MEHFLIDKDSEIVSISPIEIADIMGHKKVAKYLDSLKTKTPSGEDVSLSYNQSMFFGSRPEHHEKFSALKYDGINCSGPSVLLN